MSLHLWIREYVTKYSFITKTEFKNAILYIYYEKNGNLKSEHLPFRATKIQLQKKIEKIKHDINFYENKIKDIEAGKYKIKSKDVAFLHTTGEK